MRLWLSLPEGARAKYRITSVLPEARPWVRMLLYRAETGHQAAIDLRERLFKKCGRKGWVPKFAISTQQEKRIVGFVKWKR